MNNGPTLTVGASGADVRRLQRLLVMLGVLGHDDIDGTFRAPTEQAVRDLQGASGLAPDGMAGPQTWSALPADPDTPWLRTGDENGVVAAVQSALTDYRGPGTDTDPGIADGMFGELTESAVKAYQRDLGISVDGVVGDQTWWVPARAAGATLASLAGLITV